jgi:SAM-dependent methyltransferase
VSDTPWHEQDAFWETVRPVLFPQERLEGTPAEVEAMVELLDLQPEARVLDLCCGPGRHAVEFARRGYRVTGVDRTCAYLDRARAQAQEEGLEIEFVQEDMREHVRPEAYDLVINFFTSFGYFEDPDDDLRVVDNMHASLAPGGAFLLEMMGKEILARSFVARNWERIEDLIVLQERSIRDGWSWMENTWTLISEEERVAVDLSHRIYSAVELMDLLYLGGFERSEAYGDLAGSPYDERARRMIIVGWK